MFLAVVLRLRQVAPAQLPPYLGRATQSCFYELIRAADPVLATALHAADGPKGFTSSDLLRPLALRADEPRPIREWRLTSFDPQLTSLLRTRVLPAVADAGHVWIDHQRWQVEAIADGPTAHPWAGSQDPATLVSTYCGPVNPLPSLNLGFTFHSPTTFRSQGRNIPLPLPEMVFGSLLDRWNATQSTALSRDLRQFAGDEVGITRYRLSTVLVPIEQGAGQVGFVGECRYQVWQADPANLRLLHLLAAFAFWAGVGYKTTWGLGLTTTGHT